MGDVNLNASDTLLERHLARKEARETFGDARKKRITKERKQVAETHSTGKHRIMTQTTNPAAGRRGGGRAQMRN